MKFSPGSSPAAGEPSTVPPPLAEGRLCLADGRQLFWAEYGATGGIPLLYCHGTPGSHLEARLAGAAAARLGLRLIAPDRSGYGLSTASIGRSLLEVARDLGQLCDHLGLRRLLLLGVSGGAPFACAAAFELGSRVAAWGLICPVGPVADLPPNELPFFPWRLLLRWGQRPNSPLRLVPAVALYLLRKVPLCFFQGLECRLAEIDRRTLADPVVAPLLEASLATALQAGSSGLLADLASFSRSWDFSLALIRSPVLLWHGLDDRLVPPRFGELLAQRLGNCKASYLNGEGHFSLPVNHAARLLAELAELPSAAPAPWYTERCLTFPAPEQETSMEQRIASFLESPAFGVVGASSNRNKYGNKVLRCYQQQGRTVIPVNPRETTIEGLTCVPAVSALPPEVASISVITPPAITEQVVREAIDHDIRNIWMQPGAESAAAIATCEAHGVNVIADGSCVLVVLGFHDH